MLTISLLGRRIFCPLAGVGRQLRSGGTVANELGHLPKVEELNDLDRLRLETWYDKAYSDDNLFYSKRLSIFISN